jgi:hypothetical protein
MCAERGLRLILCEPIAQKGAEELSIKCAPCFRES